VKQTILLLDAEPVVRQVVSEILSRDGYSVVATATLAEALTAARERTPEGQLARVAMVASMELSIRTPWVLIEFTCRPRDIGQIIR